MSPQRTRYMKRTQRKFSGQRIEVKDGNHLVLSLNNMTTMKPLDPQLSELCKKDSQRILVPVDSSDQKNLIEIFSFDMNALLNSKKCTQLFQSLIYSGCNLNEKSIINGSTPLMVAITSKMKDIVEMLLKNGADPSLYDDEGETPLIKAIKVQETQIFDLIWQFKNNNCRIDHADMKGMTVLHWAVKMQLEKCVQTLLQNNASTNLCNKNGWPPLMYAAARGNCNIACHLLNAGSNLLAEDLNHQTAICIAFEKGMFPLARLLVSRLTVNEATQYIKHLLDKIQGLPDLNLSAKAEEKSCTNLMTCLMFSVSILNKQFVYKEIVYKQKVIARVLASCQKYLTNCNIVTLISFLSFYCCIESFSKDCSADIRFVMQFLRAGGPDFILKIASAHHQHQSKMICDVTYILPIMVISEVDNGKEWLKHHIKKLLPYVQSLNSSVLREHGSLFTQTLCEFGDLTPLLLMMERFFNYFDTTCRERQEETISELLADEVRLREKREKKRMKRQMKRQQRQAYDLSDCIGTLQEEDTLSVSSGDNMSFDELDWDQRHFSDGEETPWAIPFENNGQLKINPSLEGSNAKIAEKKKLWTEYYPVVPIPGNDNQWVTVANKRLGSKARIQSKTNGKSPRMKKKKESKIKYNIKKSESKAAQKNKLPSLKNQKSLALSNAACNIATIKDSEGLQALLNLESFTPTVVWDKIPPRRTKLSEMTEDDNAKVRRTLVSFINGATQPMPADSKNFFGSSQNNGTTYTEQVIKNYSTKDKNDNPPQKSAPKNEIAAPNNSINDLEPKPGSNSNHNQNSTTNASDTSKNSLPFFMPSIHFQLDWKPLLTNSLKTMNQEGVQFNKNPQEGIGTNRPSGGTASKNCNGLATATKRSSVMANMVQNPIPNKPKVPVSASYNILKTGTTFLLEDKTVQLDGHSKLQELNFNQENSTNTIKRPTKQNQPETTNTNMSLAKVQFTGNTDPKVLINKSGSERKHHMARFTKDPEFPSMLKAIDCEVVNFIQLNQMRKCFKRISEDQFLCNSVFGHDAFYYASCMSQNTRNILVSEFPAAFNTWPKKNSFLNAKLQEVTKVQKSDKTMMSNGSGGSFISTFCIGKSQPAGGDEKGNLNPKFLSYRWKNLFGLLLKLPLNKRCVLDGILLPEQFKEYNINPRKGHLIVLGLQSDGTELAIKIYKNDECPVKCGILKQLVQLQKLDYNFLIQYKSFSVTKDFAFLSMNVCECNVRQYIEWKLQQNTFDTIIANGLFWHMLKGLKSLHDNNILHGRLKPENLLIDSKGRLLLANYGFHHLCQHQCWSSCNGQINNAKSEYEKSWQPSEILRSEQNKKYTSKSDIQVAGMVAHFIISGGHHPFGQDDEVILNIILNDWQLHHLNEEASDIISAMLSGVPTNRPDVEDIMKHPYFWSTGRRFELLLNVGSHLALMSSSVFGLPEETRKNLLELIKILDSDNQFQEWKTQIDNSFIEELKKFFQYKDSLTGLILFIYNTWNRRNKMSCKEGKDHLQEPSAYFFRKFPKLFCAVYHHIKISSLRCIIPYRSYY